MKPFDLAVGEWWQPPAVGNYRLMDVAPTLNEGDGAGISGVIESNSGAAWDSVRKEMVWYATGGHNLLAWNGGFAYSCDPSSPYFLQFRRKFLPSPRSDGNSVIQYADGSPSPAHRYWNTVYLPWMDRVYNLPGGARWGTVATQQAEIWSVDVKRETPNATAPSAWIRHPDPTSFPPSDANTAPVCIVDPVRRRIFQWNSRGICSFNPANGVYTNHTDFDYLYSIFGASPVYLPGGPGHLLVIGGGYTQCKQLSDFAPSADSLAQHDWGMTGDTAIKDVDGCGLDYCDVDGMVYGWAGLLPGGTNRGDVYRINPATKVSTRINGGVTQPGAPKPTFTYGRFRHIEDRVFILVRSHDEAPWFYRAGPSQAKVIPHAVITPTPISFGNFIETAAITPPSGSQEVCVFLNGIDWPSDSVVDIGVYVSEDGTNYRYDGGITPRKADLRGNRCHYGAYLPQTVNTNRRVKARISVLAGAGITAAGSVVIRNSPDAELP